MQMKECKKCGNYLPLSDFPKSNQTKDGLYYYCRECQRTRDRASKTKNQSYYEMILEKQGFKRVKSFDGYKIVPIDNK